MRVSLKVRKKCSSDVLEPLKKSVRFSTRLNYVKGFKVGFQAMINGNFAKSLNIMRRSVPERKKSRLVADQLVWKTSERRNILDIETLK